MIRKLQQSLEVLILARELCFYKERSVFRHVSASHLRNVCCLNLAFARSRPSSKKWYLRLYLTQIIHSNDKMLFAWQKIVYQSFYGAPLTLRYLLLQGKVLCFARVGKSLARCLFLKRSKDLVEKITVSCKSNANDNRRISRFVPVIYRWYISDKSHGSANAKTINQRDIGTIYAISRRDIALARLRCNDISQSETISQGYIVEAKFVQRYIVVRSEPRIVYNESVSLHRNGHSRVISVLRKRKNSLSLKASAMIDRWLSRKW